MPSNESAGHVPRTRSWWTLRAKWTLAVLGVALAPMIVLGLSVLEIQRRGLSQAEKELEAAVVDEAAATVLDAMNQASDVAQRTSAVFADEGIDVDGRARLLGDIVGRAPATSGVAFFDEERRFVDAVIPANGSPPSHTGALQVPPEGRGFRVISLSDSVLLRYESPLEGRVRGFLVVGLARDALDARLGDLSLSRFGAKGRVYLVDESLDILGGRTRTARVPIFEVAEIGPRPSTGKQSFATELLLTTEFHDEGIDKVGTIRTMPLQRWALVVERPTTEAFRALTAARTAILLSVAGFAAFVVAAGVLVVRRILGPIGSLMGLIQQYGRRDFDARSGIRTGDELEALGSSLEHMADDLSKSEHEIRGRARTEANLRRYMPAEAAEAAIEGSFELGGAKRRVTVVFADVVAFTSFAETTSPEKAVAFLNELFTILSEIVFRHGGMVDKFIGDCIMAVFRSDDRDTDDVARALAAAEDMHSFVASNLPRWREAYAFTVELGIGISTGDVLLGNLGSSSRMEYTVIGDAVNVAARLETLARPRQTLTTQEVVAACPELTFASLGPHSLRGKTRAVEVFEVVT